jgi:DNA-binding beta-propeller fold protein YncE
MRCNRYNNPFVLITKFSFGVLMSLRRVAGILATGLAALLWISCGQVYRPVVLPIATTPPNAGNFHAVFGISTNVAANPGTAMQIDVAGGTDIGVANMGQNPTHAAILPNNSLVFVASGAGSLCPSGPDNVTAFTPATDSTTATGLGTPIVFNYPNAGTSQMANITAIAPSAAGQVTVFLSSSITASAGQSVIISNVPVLGYNGCFSVVSATSTSITYADPVPGLTPTTGGTVELPAFCPYLPDFVATAQNSAVFVANFGVEGNLNCGLASTDSVASLSPSLDSITNFVYLGANTHPVSLAETPDGLNLYVANEGGNGLAGSVVDLSPTDLSTLAPVSTSTFGSTPVWAVARPDSRRVYVLMQDTGNLLPIDTASNTVLLSTTNLSVGAGANFILFDPNLDRLYVTNPATSTLYVFSATGGIDPATGKANDTPMLLKTISFAAGSTPCPNGCSPVSVAAMPDGSRFYVASYQLAPACPDPNVGTGVSCIVPLLTIFNAASMAVKPVSSAYSLLSPSLSLLASSQFGATQYAVAQIPSCAPATPYVPNSTRFRMFTTAAADSSHVYVSICDAGIVADIDATTSPIATTGSNTPDTLAANIPTPLAACAGLACGAVAHITGFSITSGVATFHADNDFIVGEQVSITGLSSAAGANLNGLTLTVISTGLSGTQFECVLNPSQPNVGLTSDTGTAVPVPPLQNPVFLLTGQ